MVSTLSIVRFKVISTDIGYYKNHTVRGVFWLVHTTRKNKNIRFNVSFIFIKFN